jgi:hypothetical protein
MNYSNFAARLKSASRPTRRTYPDELMATLTDLVKKHGLTASFCIDELIKTEPEYKNTSPVALRAALSRYMLRTGSRQRLKKQA